MNEEFELQKRIASADPGRDAPELDHTVVTKAALGKPRRHFGFRGLRVGVGVGSFSLAVTAVALAVTLPAVMTPPALFTVADASGGGQKLSSSAEGTSDMAESSVYWPGWMSYEYNAGSAVSSATGNGQVFQGKLVGDPLEILKKMSILFGITGEPVRDEWSDDSYPSYSITEENAYLGIYWSGTGTWSFSNWTNYQSDCAEDATETSNDEFQSCGPQPTPELIPSASELRSEAVSLLEQVGLDFQADSITVYRDDWGAYAYLPYLTGGIDSGLQTYLNWGMDGQLTYFSSHSIELVARGSFDTISAIDAVSRISEGRWYGNPPESFYRSLEGQIAADSRMASSEPAEPGINDEIRSEPYLEDGTVPATEPDAVSIDEPLVLEDPNQDYEPEIIQLTVERAEATLLSVWDSLGNYWLVPGYVLFNDQGWFDSVISLEEGVIELPEPMVMLPMDLNQKGPAVSEMID
jgi:hypothetical protein